MGEMKTCTFCWKQPIFSERVLYWKITNKLRNGIWDASKKLRTENGATCKPTEVWQETAVKCRKGKHSDQEKKKTNPGLFPRRVRRRNEWTACSAFCRCLHRLDDLSARQCVWRVARCPPWKLANEQQVEEKAGWVAWGSAGGSPKWCVWWSLKGYWGLAAPKVSSAAFWGQAASLHWLPC